MVCYFKQANSWREEGLRPVDWSNGAYKYYRPITDYLILTFLNVFSHHTVNSNNMKTFKMTADKIETQK